MSERKVLNKYIPPTINPSKVNNKKPRGGGRNKKVRLMAPFSMQWFSALNTGNSTLTQGKKFNARKEQCDEVYLGIDIWRFFISCPICASEISFRTDPQNTDYQAEKGCVRNFEPWREEEDLEEEMRIAKELEEAGDPMRALEARTLEAKREMDILDALDEIRTKNANLERVDSDAILKRLHESVVEPKESDSAADKAEEDAELEDEAFIKGIEFVRRIEPAIAKSDDKYIIGGQGTMKRKAAGGLAHEIFIKKKKVANVTNSIVSLVEYASDSD